MPDRFPVFPTRVQDFVPALQTYFLRTDPKTGAVVETEAQAKSLGLDWGGASGFVWPNWTNYPSQTLALLKFFDRIDAPTAEKLAASQVKEYTGIALSILQPMLIPLVQLGFFDDTGPNRENIATGFSRWLERKERYREITQQWRDAAADPFTKTPARTAFATDVAGPLFLGWYPDRPAQTVLDAATPFLLARELDVAQAAMREAWDRLWEDLKGPRLPGVEKWPAWIPWAAAGVGLLALGGVGYLALRPSAFERETRRRERLRRLMSEEGGGHNPGNPGNPYAACGPVYGKLTTDERRLMPASAFGLPERRAYPMPDSSHAENAKGRAAQQLAIWKRTNGAKGLSPGDYARVVTKANRIIEQCEPQATAA